MSDGYRYIDSKFTYIDPVSGILRNLPNLTDESDLLFFESSAVAKRIEELHSKPMKINTFMPEKLKPFFMEELKKANHYFVKKDFQISWQHLERAHILGQPYPYQHTLAHWKMLLFGLKTKNTKEIIGQIPRLLVGGIKSFVGEIPIGNTGGANVSPLKSIEIPADLNYMIHEYS